MVSPEGVAKARQECSSDSTDHDVRYTIQCHRFEVTSCLALYLHVGFEMDLLGLELELAAAAHRWALSTL